MKQNKISKNWINKQKSDIYVRESKKQGYRSRSAFKLIEIDQKFRFLSDSKLFLDLGSAPGSWSQVASEKIKNIGDVQRKESPLIREAVKENKSTE